MKPSKSSLMLCIIMTTCRLKYSEIYIGRTVEYMSQRSPIQAYWWKHLPAKDDIAMGSKYTWLCLSKVLHDPCGNCCVVKRCQNSNKNQRCMDSRRSWKILHYYIYICNIFIYMLFVLKNKIKLIYLNHAVCADYVVCLCTQSSVYWLFDSTIIQEVSLEKTLVFSTARL